jgi:hypothetical protein
MNFGERIRSRPLRGGRPSRARQAG